MVSDLCLSQLTAVEGGFEAEGAYREDLHEPGDASGLYLYFRYQDRRLAIDAADWEDPSDRSPFLSLEYEPDPTDHSGMPCPLD